MAIIKNTRGVWHCNMADVAEGEEEVVFTIIFGLNDAFFLFVDENLS